MACANCVCGSVHEGTPIGQEITLAGLKTYATGDENSKRVVVFGVDIFGYKFNNTRLLADEYAARGFRVYIPDLFDGYEFPQWTLTLATADEPTFFQKLLRPFAMLVFIPFAIRNTKASQTAKIGGVLKHIRETQPDTKVGFIGYCWGGRYAITMNHEFDATVACHPSLVSFPDELNDVSKPISFALAETDHAYDGAKGKETEKILKGKGLTEVEVVVYGDGVAHGWTIRTNMADEKKKAARDRAKEQAISWFEKHLATASE